MSRPGPWALDGLAPLLVQLHVLPGLTEKSRGTFCRKSLALLHFQGDPAGLLADLRDGSGEDFERIDVTETAGRGRLLRIAAERGRRSR